MSAAIAARVLVPGTAEGTVLRLSEPLSFWGGVDPATGRIVDARHPQRGLLVAGTVLIVPETRGSSSSSSVMLELIHAGCAPAALLLGTVDAILILGVLVAREMGLPAPPAFALGPLDLHRVPPRCRILADGTIRSLDAAAAPIPFPPARRRDP
jgi:predicted aconitase with swiveling domain